MSLKSWLRDAHYYGGLSLASGGVGWWLHPGAGMLLGGAGLVAAVLLAPTRGNAQAVQKVRPN